MSVVAILLKKLYALNWAKTLRFFFAIADQALGAVGHFNSQSIEEWTCPLSLADMADTAPLLHPLVELELLTIEIYELPTEKEWKAFRGSTKDAKP